MCVCACVKVKYSVCACVRVKHCVCAYVKLLKAQREIELLT